MGQPVNFYDKTESIKTVYLGVHGATTLSFKTDAVYFAQVAHATTFKRILIDRAVAPGAGAKIRCTLMKNSVTTALVAFIENTQTTASFDSDIDISKFDVLTTRVEYINGPTYGTTAPMAISYLVQGTGEQIMFSSGLDGHGSNATTWGNFMGWGGWSISDLWPGRDVYFPVPGTLQNFNFMSDASIFAVTTSTQTAQRAFGVFLGSARASTDLSLIAYNTGTQVTTFSDATTQLAVSKYDTYVLRQSYTRAGQPQFVNSAANITASIGFIPDTIGNYVYSIGGGNFIGLDTRDYYAPGCGKAGVDPDKELFVTMPIAGTINGAVFIRNTTEGLGNAGTGTITLRVNSVDTSLVMTLNPPATSAESTVAVAVSVNDRISWVTRVTSEWNAASPEGNVTWLFLSSLTTVYPLFIATYSSGTLPAAVSSSYPINFYSKTGGDPVNFYSLP